jgi:hypothetical protein
MLKLDKVTERIYELLEGKEEVVYGLKRNKYQRYLLDPETIPPSNLKKDHYYIKWGFPVPVEGKPYNQYDPMRLMKINFTVYLYIPVTGVTGKATESTLHGLIRKYNEDISNIRECLSFGENYGNVSEQVVSVTSINDVSVSIENDVLVIEIPFETQQWILVGIDSTWEPVVIPNLYAWYRTDDVQVIGGKVSQLNDKSGNGRHAIQTNVAYRPTYYPNGGLNDKPYFATTENLALGTGLLAGAVGEWNFLHNGTGATVFVVAKTSGNNWLWLLGTQLFSINEIGYGISSTADTGNKMSISVGDGSSVVVGFGLNGLVIDPNKYHKFITVYKESQIEYEDSFFIKIDNKKLSTASSKAPSQLNSGQLGIGFGGTGYYSADSQFHEIIIFNRRLSPEEIRQIESYLNNRYGI